MTMAERLPTIGGTVPRGKSRAKPPTQKGWLVRQLVPPSAWGANPAEYDPVLTERTISRAGVLFGRRRWFRLESKGFENVPRAPALLVSNHSGGTVVLDAWGLMIAWYRTFGMGRPLHPTTHELVLSTETTGRFFAQRGVLHADPEVALSALTEHRHDVLVMPGGDQDAWRPFKDRYRVQFAGHVGYARLALKAGVPIVPVAHAGAHHSLLVISDGRRIAKALHVDVLARAKIWPIHLSLPWGLTFGPLPHLPLPVKLRYRAGEPIEARKRKNPADREVKALDEKVRTVMQGLLDRLAQER